MQQLDLFAGGWAPPQPDGPQTPVAPPIDAPETMSDAELAAAIPEARLASCHMLVDAAVQRRLDAAIPALEALCRRFKGFGLEHAIPEQIAALRGLAAIGGPGAASAIQRIFMDGVVADPGLPEAVRAAVALRCVLPEPVALGLLRHAEPEIRALGCRCAPRKPSVTALLVSLLDDLNPGVAREAAIALAHRGQAEARPLLLDLLRRDPDSRVIDALADVADDECTVLIGRIGRHRPDLLPAALVALETIETPRAAALRESLRNRDESHRAG